MKKFLCSLVLMIAFGLGTLVAQTGLQQTDASTAGQANASNAQNPAELSQKVDELESLVKQLQSELTAMKQQQPHQGPHGIAEVASTSMPTSASCIAGSKRGRRSGGSRGTGPCGSGKSFSCRPSWPYDAEWVRGCVLRV